MIIKHYFHIFTLCLLLPLLAACSTNPATGESQFTALMSPHQEVKVGAQEHGKIIQQYGTYKNAKVTNYVNAVGQKVVKNTERPEVQYQFHVLDSPIVNAFALPGGYIYISRGLLALANSEAEMASVLAHEAGHITARHSAERYSRGVVTSLGAAILSTAVGSSGVSQALGLGSNLYMKSYSRGQESQADTLGIRYLTRAGYTPQAMSSFLKNLQADTALQAQMDGKKAQNGTNYFSTHPATQARVTKTVQEASAYPGGGQVNREGYLRAINGMLYGDSAEQGFVRGNEFLHPVLGFKFSVPSGYKLINQPSSVVAAAQNGAVIIFDMMPNKQALSPMRFLKETWMKGEAVAGAENITINGMPAATASFKGAVNGKNMNIRLVSIRWNKNQIARFQVALPYGLSPNQLNDIKSSTYSFKRMSTAEKNRAKPYHVRVVTAKAGQSVASLSKRMVSLGNKDLREKHFRVLNGLGANEGLVSGRSYKIVAQ